MLVSKIWYTVHMYCNSLLRYKKIIFDNEQYFKGHEAKKITHNTKESFVIIVNVAVGGFQFAWISCNRT